MNHAIDPLQSRWGFHPCDYSFYRKLKLLHRWYHQTLHDHAAWRRWSRKEPQNRVIRAYLRDEQGRKCGVQATRPRPEPTFCPALVRDEAPHDHGIVELFRQARTPQPAAVAPFAAATVQAIDELFREAAAHFAMHAATRAAG